MDGTLMNTHTSSSDLERTSTQSRVPPDSRQFPAAHAGWYLKRERIARGMALNKVAAVLKVRERYIWAIEEGVDAEFPQAANFLTIVGRYADLLEFDSSTLIEHYREIMPSMAKAQRKGFGDIIALKDIAALLPALSAGRRPLAMVGATFVVAVFAAGVWFTTGGLSSDGDITAANGVRVSTVSVEAQAGSRATGKNAPSTMDLDDPLITAAVSSNTPQGRKNAVFRVQMMDFTGLLKRHGFKEAPPQARDAIENELDAAVSNDLNKS